MATAQTANSKVQIPKKVEHRNSPFDRVLYRSRDLV